MQYHIRRLSFLIYTQNKLVCEKCINQRIDFEYNEDIIFLKENYRRYKAKPYFILKLKLTLMVLSNWETSEPRMVFMGFCPELP